MPGRPFTPKKIHSGGMKSHCFCGILYQLGGIGGCSEADAE